MMKTFPLLFIVLAFSLPSLAQLRLGYLQDGTASLPFTSIKECIRCKASGINLDIRASGSLLGNILFKNRDSKFMIGDHIGAGFGLGFWKGSDFPIMLGLNFQFGVKAAYSINDNLEVGVKYVGAGLDLFTDMKASFALGVRPAIIPSVRFKNIMGSAGFGTSVLNSDVEGKFMMVEGRYLLSVDKNKSRNPYLFFRFENYSAQKIDDKSTGNQLILGIGFM